MRASTVLPAGRWDPAREVDQVRADYDGRHRRRVLLATVGGAELMLDLPRTMHLRDGNGLVLDGSNDIVRVVAEPEALLAVTARDTRHLTRLAWHLGNRHLPTMLDGTRLCVRFDQVIADMLVGLGATVEPLTAPFDPETGAYEPQADAANGAHHHHHDDH